MSSPFSLLCTLTLPLSRAGLRIDACACACFAAPPFFLSPLVAASSPQPPSRTRPTNHPPLLCWLCVRFALGKGGRGRHLILSLCCYARFIRLFFHFSLSLSVSLFVCRCGCARFILVSSSLFAPLPLPFQPLRLKRGGERKNSGFSLLVVMARVGVGSLIAQRFPRALVLL